MEILIILSWALVASYILSKLFGALYDYKPLNFQLDAEKIISIFKVNYDNLKPVKRLQIICFLAGIFIMTLIIGFKNKSGHNILILASYILALFCIIEPLMEILFFRKKYNKSFQLEMTAKTRRQYYDWFYSQSLKPYFLNSVFRKRLRFCLLSIGTTILIILLIP